MPDFGHPDVTGMKMKNQPITLQFVMPKHASAGAKQHFQYLRKLISRNETIHLQLSDVHADDHGFVARISFNDASQRIPEIKLDDDDLANEDDIRHAAERFLQNPLAKSLRPAQRVHAVMSILSKPVKLQTFCQICYETLRLSPETTRGTLNKNRSLYLSPKHGVWCTIELGDKMGWPDCR